MFIAGFVVADLLQRVRERLLAMERVPQHERDRLLVALVDTNWNMSKATQKLQRWPAVRSALLPSAQRLPAVRSREKPGMEPFESARACISIPGRCSIPAATVAKRRGVSHHLAAAGGPGAPRASRGD